MNGKEYFMRDLTDFEIQTLWDNGIHCWYDLMYGVVISGENNYKQAKKILSR